MVYKHKNVRQMLQAAFVLEIILFRNGRKRMGQFIINQRKSITFLLENGDYIKQK